MDEWSTEKFLYLKMCNYSKLHGQNFLRLQSAKLSVNYMFVNLETLVDEIILIFCLKIITDLNKIQPALHVYFKS